MKEISRENIVLNNAAINNKDIRVVVRQFFNEKNVFERSMIAPNDH